MPDQLNNQSRSEIYEIVYQAIQDVLYENSFNLEKELQRQALAESGDFVRRNIPLHLSVHTRWELMDRALNAVADDGLLVEFGVWIGRSINRIAKRFPDRTVYGFDSFEGLPDPWIFSEKAFHNLPAMPVVEENVELVKGWFDATLPAFRETHAGPCAFINIDSDVYSSAKTIFECLGDRIIPGTVIFFDEFFNYPGWETGEFKAWAEFVEDRNVEFEYLGFTGRSVRNEVQRQHGHSGIQVAVRIESLAGSP
jgi:predicted O-methyltransferase YrrM